MDPELRAYLDERFERIDRRFEQVDWRFEQMDRRFEQMDRRFEQVDKRVEQVEETGRHTLILVEGMRHEIHLIAEAFVGLSDRMEVFQKETKLELEKAPAWLEPYFRGLDIRVKGLESVVEHRQGDIMDTVRMILGKPPLKPSPAGESPLEPPVP